MENFACTQENKQRISLSGIKISSLSLGSPRTRRARVYWGISRERRKRHTLYARHHSFAQASFSIWQLHLTFSRYLHSPVRYVDKNKWHGTRPGIKGCTVREGEIKKLYSLSLTLVCILQTGGRLLCVRVNLSLAVSLLFCLYTRERESCYQRQRKTNNYFPFALRAYSGVCQLQVHRKEMGYTLSRKKGPHHISHSRLLFFLDGTK